MIVYTRATGDDQEEELDLIRRVCAFEGVSCFELPDGYVKTHHKDHPVVVVGNEFIDPSDRRVVLFGFYQFVQHLAARK